MASSSYARRIERYMAAHPGLSAAEAKRAARGHAHTGEHGVTATALGNNRVAVTIHDEKYLERALRAVTQLEGRVSIAVTDKDGNTRVLFENKGHSGGVSVDYLKERIAEDGLDGVVEDALASGTNLGSGAGVFRGDAIREYQLIVQ